MLMRLFSLRRPMPPKSSWELPFTSSGRPTSWALKRSTRRSSSGSTLYLRACSRHSAVVELELFVPAVRREPQLLKLGQLLWHLGGEVVRLPPVRVGVIELPD